MATLEVDPNADDDEPLAVACRLHPLGCPEPGKPAVYAPVTRIGSIPESGKPTFAERGRNSGPFTPNRTEARTT